MHPNEQTLNDYVDRSLDGAEQAEVERHLESCPTCRGVVDDVSQIRRAARALTSIEPPAFTWRQIEKAIRSETAGRTTPGGARAWVPGPRQLGWLALAAALLLATVVGLRFRPLAPPTEAPSPSAAADGSSVDAADTVESELRQAEEHYNKAIKGLEQITKEGESSLDPTTVATLQKNLSVIDQAISESRTAVQSQPDSEPARTSLLDNFAMKIALLQDTVSLMNEMRKGNDAGAAQIVSGLK